VSPLTREAVQGWLDAYVEAWESYDRERIAALFSEDAEYRFHPYDEPIRGREAIADAWLGEGGSPNASERDAPGTYAAEYRVFAVDADRAVATGKSTYVAQPGGQVTDIYFNCFVMRFEAGGACREFTEWFMKRTGP
jgi:ketosteroid isomerase-like protein